MTSTRASKRGSTTTTGRSMPKVLLPRANINSKAKGNTSAVIKRCSGNVSAGKSPRLTVEVAATNDVMKLEKALKQLGIKPYKGPNKDLLSRTRALKHRLIAHQQKIEDLVKAKQLNLARNRASSNEVYEVVEVINSSVSDGVLELLVLFKGFAVEDSTWEEVGNVDEGVVRDFYNLFPSKPGKKIAAAAFGWGDEEAEASSSSSGKGKGNGKAKAKPSTTTTTATKAAAAAEEKEDDDDGDLANQLVEA